MFFFSSLNRNIVLIFASCILARIIFFQLTGFIGDDAFITFRYAENLSHGLGFVYNEGQPVLGTTTPLFTLILACLAVIGLNIPSAALAVSLFASGMTAVVIYRFALRLRFMTLAWLPALGYILWPRSLPIDSSGMETALFTLLTTAAFYYQHKREDIYALALGTLAAVTRPEGFAVVFLLIGWNGYLHPERIKKYLIVTGFLILPWLIFATIYFGSPIPNSVMAKVALYDKLGEFTTWETLVYFMGWHRPFGWIMSAMALLGGYWLNKKQNFGWLEILWLAGLVLFYSLGKARMFFWYTGPLYPLYFIFVTASICFVVERIEWLRLRRAASGLMFGLLMSAVLLYGCLKPIDYFSGLQKSQLAAHYEVGLYLNNQAAPEEIVAAEDIGYMGFYSKRIILDRDGLVSPEVIPYNHQADYYGLIKDKKPDWVVALKTSPISQFIREEKFLSDYQLMQNFESEKFVYAVFKRTKPASKNQIENRQPQK